MKIKNSILIITIVISLAFILKSIIGIHHITSKSPIIKTKFKKSINLVLHNMNIKSYDKILLIHISSFGCNLCMNNQINIIKTLINEKQINVPFIWVIRTSNIRKYNFIVKKTKTENNHIFLSFEDRMSIIDNLNKPYYVLLNSDLEIISTYIPNNKDIKSIKEYFHRINE